MCQKYSNMIYIISEYFNICIYMCMCICIYIHIRYVVISHSLTPLFTSRTQWDPFKGGKYTAIHGGYRFGFGSFFFCMKTRTYTTEICPMEDWTTTIGLNTDVKIVFYPNFWGKICDVVWSEFSLTNDSTRSLILIQQCSAQGLPLWRAQLLAWRQGLTQWAALPPGGD